MTKTVIPRTSVVPKNLQEVLKSPSDWRAAQADMARKFQKLAKSWPDLIASANDPVLAAQSIVLDQQHEVEIKSAYISPSDGEIYALNYQTYVAARIVEYTQSVINKGQQIDPINIRQYIEKMAFGCWPFLILRLYRNNIPVFYEALLGYLRASCYNLLLNAKSNNKKNAWTGTLKPLGIGYGVSLNQAIYSDDFKEASNLLFKDRPEITPEYLVELPVRVLKDWVCLAREIQKQQKQYDESVSLDTEIVIELPSVSTPEPEQETVGRSIISTFEERLLPSQRQLLTLLQQEFTVREISRQLGVTEPTVRRRIETLGKEFNAINNE